MGFTTLERKLLQAHLKLESSISQWQYIRSTIDNGCIPQNIKAQSNFKISINDAPDLQYLCQSYFYIAASRATECIKAYHKQKINMLRGTIRKISEDLVKENGEMTQEFKDVLAKNIQAEKIKLQSKHNKKLERDLESSKVYTPINESTTPQLKKKCRKLIKHKKSQS